MRRPAFSAPSWEVWLAAAILLIDLACGVALCIATVPFSGLDEPWHYLRAEQMSHGQLLARKLAPNRWGGTIDANAFAFSTANAFDLAASRPAPRAAMDRIAREDRMSGPKPQVAEFSAMASYPPLAYLPSAAGIGLARVTGHGLWGQMYAGRLANLLAYLALAALAVRALPAGRWATLAFLGRPTALYLAACFSGDPVNIALPVLLGAWCLRFRLDCDSKLDKVSGAALLLLTLALGLLKVTTVIFAGAVLLLPARLFPSRRAGWLFKAAAIGGAFALAFAWLSAYPFIPGEYWGLKVDPHANLAAILHRPLHHLFLMEHLLWWARDFFWHDSYDRIGGGPGPYHFFVSGPWIVIGTATIGFLALLPERATRRDWPAAGWFLLLAAGYVAATLTAFAIAYTPTGANYIGGVQGRYFLVAEWLVMMAAALTLRLPTLAAWVRPVLLLGSVGAQVAIVVIAVGRYRPLWG